MTNRKIENFKKRVGWELLSEPGADGVKADWSLLPSALASEVSGLRRDRGLFPESDQMYPTEPGLAEANWCWTRGLKRLDLTVFVSGVGSQGARARLLRLATDTSTVESTFPVGPAGLGELAIQSLSSDMVAWVFRNVCVEASRGEAGTDVFQAARRIQAFMEAHVVRDLARHVPRVAAIDVSPKPIRVGDIVTVSVRMAGDAPASSFLVKFLEALKPRFDPLDPNQVEKALRSGIGLLDPLGANGLEARYKATDSGRTEVEIMVADSKTLLSPKAGVFIDVLPAR